VTPTAEGGAHYSSIRHTSPERRASTVFVTRPPPRICRRYQGSAMSSTTRGSQLSRFPAKCTRKISGHRQPSNRSCAPSLNRSVSGSSAALLTPLGVEGDEQLDPDIPPGRSARIEPIGPPRTRRCEEGWSRSPSDLTPSRRGRVPTHRRLPAQGCSRSRIRLLHRRPTRGLFAGLFRGRG
jgi:hypothetical protein